MQAMNRRPAVLALLVLLLAAASAWAATIGSAPIAFSDIIAALTRPDGSREHLVVATVRVPRIVAAMIVGASLAVAGAILQAMTGNPLASPGILGINAGAAFAVVLALVFLGSPSREAHIWYAFAGAGVAAALVFAIASTGPGGATPVKLALSGAIFATFLASLTAAILIFDARTLSAVRLWTAGSLAAPEMSSVLAVLPYTVLGLAAAVVISGQVTTLSLGADVARALGQNLALWNLVCGACVIVLAGSAVALAGPVGFVGLVVPHIVRLTAGTDYRWIIPFCAAGGALLVVVSDAALRHFLPASDVPVGVTMALIGAPFFIHLARSRTGLR